MSKIKELETQLAEVKAQASAIVALADQEKREVTEQEQTEIYGLVGKDAEDKTCELSKIQAQIDYRKRIETIAKSTIGTQADLIDSPRISVPSGSVRGNLKAFKGPDAEKDAYISGQWLAANVFGNAKAREWCESRGIRAAMSTADNTKGGFTVPESLETAVIRMVENYGVFRQNIGTVWPLPGGSVKVPKRNGGFTVYYPGENSAITSSDMAFAQVQLTARKMGILTQASTELMEDSAVMLADLYAVEFGFAFAKAEDEMGFKGDGTSTYGGVVGLANALAAGAITTTASNVDTFAELTIATVHAAQSKLPEYGGMSPKWYMSKACWAGAFERLALAAGGNAAPNYSGALGYSFMGYPVVLTQVLAGTSDTTDHSGVIFAYFGDLSMAASMGDARGVTIAASTEKYFAEDSLAIRATKRTDIVIHDVGTATVAGAIVGLKFNAS